jgi:adenosylcobinamide-GDP ribazoletransferase
VGDGLRLALTTFTVAPLRPGRVDRPTAAVAMSLAPFVGLALGAALGVAGIGLRFVGSPSLLAAVLMITLGVAATRGLHVDGLADTADALGCYGDPQRALAVMKRPEVGAFGVAAIILGLLVQATGAAAVLGRPWPAALAGVAAATGAGRAAVGWACRRGVPAARPDGLGALVAGTVGWPVALAGSAVVAAVAVAAVPGRPWQGPLAVAAGLGAAALLTRHTGRRFGGITGDVLGAAVETATATAYLVLALSPG